MSKPKRYSWMTKDKLMTYTFGALLAIAVVTIVMWWNVTALDVMTLQPIGMSYGLTVLINCLIAIGIAVGIDVLLYKVASDSPLNIMSAAVFGLIVALSYTVGEPVMRASEVLPLLGPQCFIWVALITVVGMVLFKKVLGKGRKYVNPAAAAKLIVLALVGLLTVLIPADHLVTGGLQVPSLAGPINYDTVPGNGAAGFGFFLVGCFANPASPIPTTVPTQSDIFNLLTITKFHSWAGGASSIAVIIIGIALFVLARRYIKWRITLTYFVSVAIMATILNFAYPGGDLILRLGFELFVGSSVFLAFFMATDPATTPLTHIGQVIFGVALGVLTVLIQTYMGFFGGSILALVIMNLTCPFLDKVGKGKPSTEKKEPKLPKAIQQTEIKTYDCIRCGACMTVCCHKLSPILIKQAFDKMDVEQMNKLNADYCTGCGHCSYVCPSRIDLKASVLRAKVMLRGEETRDNETKGAAIEVPNVAVPKVDVPKAAIAETVIPEFKIVDSAHGHVIERIVPAHAKKLNSLKIFTSSDLLEAGATPIARKDLAAKTGISDSLILKYVNIADLLRIEGIGEKYANLLEVSGVDTVVELARRIPENLHAKMIEVNEKQQLVERTPTLAGVTKWVSDAQALPRMIEY